MLKVQTEYLENRQAKLIVSVADERVQQELKAAATRLSNSVNIPGFRRGKAPYQIIARYVGEDTLYDEALEPLGQSVYKEALEETGLEPYAPGTLDDVSRNPLVLTFAVSLQPEVDLGAYRDVRVPFEVPKVTDEDVQHQVDHLLDDQAVLEPVERPVAWEDVALLDIKGVFEDQGTIQPEGETAKKRARASEVFLDRTGVRVLVGENATYPVPGFPERVIGMAAGDSRSFSITLPSTAEEIAEELQGRTIHFDVKCAQVFKRELPELDDEFARSVGDYADLADLRSKLRSQLEHEAEIVARNVYVSEIFAKLLADGTVKLDYPPVIIEDQLDDMVEDFERRLRRDGMNLKDYLSLNNVTLEDVRAGFRESAEEQVKRGLILSKLCEIEQITVEDDEIEDEIRTQLLSFGTQAALAKQLFSSPEVKRTIVSRRLTDKGIERLTQIARGEAPELSSDSKTEERKKSGKAKSGAAKATASKARAKKSAE